MGGGLGGHLGPLSVDNAVAAVAVVNPGCLCGYVGSLSVDNAVVAVAVVNPGCMCGDVGPLLSVDNDVAAVVVVNPGCLCGDVGPLSHRTPAVQVGARQDANQVYNILTYYKATVPR